MGDDPLFPRRVEEDIRKEGQTFPERYSSTLLSHTSRQKWKHDRVQP
jgi:hypothetical protein